MRTLSLALLLALVACDTVQTFPPESGTEPEGVMLTTDHTTYDNDDQAVLTLHNRSPRRIETSVLGCALLERRTDAGWSPSPDGNGRFCPAVLVVLEADEVAAATVNLEDVPDGTYRFVQGADVGDVASASFEVR